MKDQAILEGIKNSLRVGQIYKSGPKAVQLRVESFAELEKILMHFHKYPLQTKKRADCEL